MKTRGALIVVVAAALLAAGCSKPAPATDKASTDDPNYMRGYHAGLDDGQSDTCNKIATYKRAMSDELRDQGICP